MRRSTVALVAIAAAVIAIVVVVRTTGGERAISADPPSTSVTSIGTGPDPTDVSTTATPPTIVTPGLVLPDGSTVCDLYGVWAPTGTIANTELVEASGIAASRTTEGVFWSHNDSRDGARAYAFTADGADLGVFDIPDAFAFDWEDMGAGPDASGLGNYLYFGDIGDNFDIRGGVISVHRVRDLDPATLDGRFPESERITYEYPEGNHNAEALFVDPVEPAMYVVTKSNDLSLVFRGALTTDAGTIVLEMVAALPLGAEVSGADISRDGSVIAFRGYRTVWMWHRLPGQTIADALTADPCEGQSPEERQGEAITVDDDFSYWTISEGVTPAVHRVPFKTNP